MTPTVNGVNFTGEQKMTKWEKLLELERKAKRNIKKFVGDVNMFMFWSNALKGIQNKIDNITVEEAGEIVK